MFDKERFHNVLALSLGYERMVNDKRISIEVDDSDDPWVSLKIQNYPEVIRFKASDTLHALDLKEISTIQVEVKTIIDAILQSYLEASRIPF